MAVSGGCEADEADDWVLDSLDRYERLHVFELQEPTLCMEWSHDSTAIFVAGYSQVKHNELLQLLLPEKLLAVDKQTLLARRDFKIGRGALAKEPIYHIRCVDRNVVITAGLKPELTVWGPDPGSPDLLVSTGNVATPTPTLTDPDGTELLISWSRDHPHTLVSGSSLDTLQVTDLTTLKPVWSRGRESSAEDAVIHAIESPVGECNVFLTCSSRGELTAWDSRLADSRGPLVKYSPHPPPTPGADPGGTATTKEEEEGGYAMAVCGDRCATFSDRGRLRVYERRGPSWLPLASCDLDLRQSSSVVSQFITTGEQPIRPCVQFSESSNEVSVSGPGRGVTVYDITSWSNDIIIFVSCRDEAPLYTDPSLTFRHEGHEVDSPACRVTVHSWHPSFHSMILSSDTDGIMHAWQWNNHTN